MTGFIGLGLLLSLLGGVDSTNAIAADDSQTFRAGAAAIDISPTKFPVIISGGFLQGRADRLNDPLFARALVLDDGSIRLALVVVDNLMMPRELLDDAKRRAEQATGIPPERILVSANHTHSAPSVMGALGTGVDQDYAALLPGWIADSIAAAAKNLAPAKIGWTVVSDSQHTNCRRWIYRPDRVATDPFGEPSIRAMMHPGYQNPNFIGPSGPEDPGLTILSAQSPDGRPIAVVANYSMHYFGAGPVSADYFGRFSRKLTQLVGAEQSAPPFVAMMSQGTAGDLHWMDYSRPATGVAIDTYANEVAEVAFRAYQTIQYRDEVPLAMAERKLTLGRRTPDEKRLAWAREIVAAMQGRTLAANQREVYALEQIYLHDEPQREIVLQAVRIGDLGIAALPNEVFGITGLKIKAQSPLEPTFNIELANGGDGYIPPPEQHALGGYTTWPARTAGLEVQAEPQIVEATLRLLEQVAGKPRRPVADASGAYAQAVLASQPAAYWRLHDFAGLQARDVAGHAARALYEPGVAFYLDGPTGAGFCAAGQSSRAAHFAGGRLQAEVDGLGAAYTFEAWFWNGLPNDARPVAGYLFARGAENSLGDQMGIGGTEAAAGKLFFATSQAQSCVAGATEIAVKTWNHVALVREGSRVCVYLNGSPQPELVSDNCRSADPGAKQVIVGGRGDGTASFEGKIAEVAIYARALTADEIARHFAAAGIGAE